MHEGTPHAAHRPPQAPKPGQRRPLGAISADSSLDPIEQLTELFLGDLPRPPHAASFDADDLPLPPYKTDSIKAEAPKAAPVRKDEAPAKREPAARPLPLTLQTEVVVIGHLPVAASAWVQHYASYRQRQVGSPVALLRWRGDTASLDLFGQVPVRHAVGPHASIAEAMRAAASFADTLIVSVEETREIEAAQLPGVKRVAVLTGSHDTAVVACYRALKGLVHIDSVRDGLCDLAVVVLGGPEDRSKAAGERLERTSLSYLSHAIRCEVVSERISPARTLPLFVGQASGSSTAFLRGLISQSHASELATGPSVTAGESGSLHGVSSPSGLALRFPGLRSVDARCPFAPTVELAVSAEGEMHVLAAASQAGDVPKAVADLTACASWVEVNSAVLKSAIPELARRVGASHPREHLIITEPKMVRGLLDSRLRLHLDAAGAMVDLN